MNLFSVVLIFISVFETRKCAKILGVFPVPARSHNILATSLMQGLATKGHDVTVITPREDKTVPEGGTYRNILIGDGKPPTAKGFNLFEMDTMSFIKYNLLLNFIGNDRTDKTLGDPNVQKLLKSNETFDIVIVEQFVNDALKVLAYHYKAPLVIFSTWTSNSWINPLVANPAPPSYVPEQKIEFDHRNFFDRLKNTMVFLLRELNKHLILYPAQDKIMKKHFPDAPDLNDLLYNASLVLLNSDLSTNHAVPRVPSMVDIGGFHIKPPKQLPTDLQEYLDGAKEGVIYFSMGSALQGVNLAPEKREAIVRVFSKLKYKVLWKWEGDVLPGQPPNVKLGKWFPQQDILAHSNVKAFVTHGGLLSFIESVYHGVPVLAIPVYGDQVMNAAEATSNGMGRYILYSDLDEDKFAEALNDILKNPKYRENMKRRSRVMHDRRTKPIDDADYWIRYVIRHQGATHLRVNGLDLTWYQYLSLDVAVFIFAAVLFAVYLLYISIKTMVSKLCRRSKDKVKKN